MNAAFLLVTTAWLAGSGPAPSHGVIQTSCCGGGHAAVASSGCGGGCGSSWESADCCKPGLIQRLRDKIFRRDCGGCDTCATAHTSCGDCCEREGLLSRLRGMFHRTKCTDPCADTCGGGCNGCGSVSHVPAHVAPGHVVPGGAVPGQMPRAPDKPEPLPAPKGGEPAARPLPKPAGDTVRVIPPQPVAAPVLEVTPTTAPKAVTPGARSPF